MQGHTQSAHALLPAPPGALPVLSPRPSPSSSLARPVLLAFSLPTCKSQAGVWQERTPSRCSLSERRAHQTDAPTRTLAHRFLRSSTTGRPAFLPKQTTTPDTEAR